MLFCGRLCELLMKREESEELLIGPLGMSTILRAGLQNLMRCMGGAPFAVHQKTAAPYQDSTAGSATWIGKNDVHMRRTR